MPSRDIETLIRLAADDELTSMQTQLLKEYLSESDEHVVHVHNAIDFERRLKEAVVRCMQPDNAVPVDLPFRVRAILSEDQPEIAVVGSDHIAEENDPRSNYIIKRKQWFIPSGLAAGIMIIVSVSLIAGLWGTGNTDTPTPGGSGSEISGPGRNNTEWITNYAVAEEVARRELDYMEFTLPDLSGLDFQFSTARVAYYNDTGAGMRFNYKSRYNDITLWVFNIDQNAVILDSISLDTADEEFKALHITTNSESDISTLKDIEIDLLDSYLWLSDDYGYVLSTEDGNDIPNIIAVAHAAGMPEGEITTVIIPPGK